MAAIHLLERSEIGESTWQLQQLILRRRHREVDAHQSSRKYQKHPQRRREFPPRQRKSIRLQLLLRRRVGILLLVPIQHPAAGFHHHTPRRRHGDQSAAKSAPMDSQAAADENQPALTLDPDCNQKTTNWGFCVANCCWC